MINVGLQALYGMSWSVAPAIGGATIVVVGPIGVMMKRSSKKTLQVRAYYWSVLAAAVCGLWSCSGRDSGETVDIAADSPGNANGDIIVNDDDVGSMVDATVDVFETLDGSASGDSSDDGAGGSDANADTSADVPLDVPTPPPFDLKITAPYAGQVVAAGEVAEAKVHVVGSATQLAATQLAWTLADSDGGNANAIAGAPVTVDESGDASAKLEGLQVGVRTLTVNAEAGGGDAAQASTAVVVCPTAGAIVTIDGEPPQQAMLAGGKPVVVKASVDGVVGPGATLEVVSDFDGVLGSAALAPVGGVNSTEVEITVTPTSAGEHQLSLRMTGGGAFCSSVAQASVRVCGAEIVEDFAKDTTGTDWVKVGDAAWDSGGWLELTGNAGSKGGAFYNKALFVQPGDVRMTMRIATGGGINGGADGFAMTIFEGKSPTDVDAYLKLAGNGGCLGYGVSGACGNSQIKAFHVEIDTWVNKGDPNTDPPGITGNNGILGQGNHIAVHKDGDAGNALLWLPEPGAAAISVEDLAWHTVTIVIQGDKLTIRLDDTVSATKTLTGLDFRGGYVIFSGSTGWATNHHRIDDLRILHQCN